MKIWAIVEHYYDGDFNIVDYPIEYFQNYEDAMLKLIKYKDQVLMHDYATSSTINKYTIEEIKVN